MGMAVFAEAFIEVTGLSRTELSLAYMLGTIFSALFLTRAGRFYLLGRCHEPIGNPVDGFQHGRCRVLPDGCRVFWRAFQRARRHDKRQPQYAVGLV